MTGVTSIVFRTVIVTLIGVGTGLIALELSEAGRLTGIGTTTGVPVGRVSSLIGDVSPGLFSGGGLAGADPGGEVDFGLVSSGGAA